MIQDVGWKGGQHLMARAYSLDLRERVVAAVAAGESCRAVATKFKVSVASVVKWSQRFRANASAAAYKVGGRRPYALAGERDWLLARLADKPDITLRALGAELAARGIKVSHSAVWHFFEHEGISFKKKLRARGHQLQKKACKPANRIVRTSPGGGRNGESIKGGLIRPAWSSSMTPGPKPT
jgi:transposase